MKKMFKALSSEQKVAVVDFVANWLKKGKDLEEGIGSSYLIRDGKIMYMISMSVFKKDKVSAIVVMNYDLDVSVTVDVDDLPSQSQHDIKIIENKIEGFLLSVGQGQDLTDLEFNKITNLEPDLQMARSKKISHLKGIINDET
jgi:hypothetical protein